MTVVCRACKAPIVWAITEAGRPMPLDAELEPAPVGTIATYEHGERLVAVVVPKAALERLAAGTELYRSHFASCPFADEFRKSRS